MHNTVMEMIDIGPKEVVLREALASGTIKIKKSTVDAIQKNQIRKGDVFEISKVAGIIAAKNTSQVIPFCHQIPLDSVEPELQILNGKVEAKCTVRAHNKTGVEMDALNCVSAILLTVWDMVKYLEKDASGNYPGTVISDMKVLRKRKGENGSQR